MIHVFQCYSIIRHKHVLWSTYLFVSATSVGRSWKCLKCLMVLTMMLMEACLALSTSQHGHHRLAPMRKYFRFYLFLSNHLQFLHIHNNVYIYIHMCFLSLSLSLCQATFRRDRSSKKVFPSHVLVFPHVFVEDCWRRSQLGGLEGCLARHDFQIKAQRHEKNRTVSEDSRTHLKKHAKYRKSMTCPKHAR